MKKENSNFNDLTFEEKLNMIHKKKRNTFILKLCIVFSIFSLLIIYLVTPLSQVSNYSLSGNLNFNKQEILEIMHLNKKSNLYFISKKQCDELLNNHPLIKSGKVNISPLGFKVTIEENTPVISQNEVYYLKDGEIFDNELFSNPLISSYLENLKNNLPICLSSDKLSKKDLTFFSDIYYSLSNEYQNNVKYFKVNDDNTYSFFSLYKENFYEIIYDIPLSMDSFKSIKTPLDKKGFEIYENGLIKGNELVEKNYQSEETTFKYYSIKVIISRVIDNGNDCIFAGVANND